MGLLKIQNLEYKYEIIKTQLLRKVNGAQSSTRKMFIPLKEIFGPNALLKGLE